MRAAPTDESPSHGFALEGPKQGDSLAELGEAGCRKRFCGPGKEEVNLDGRETVLGLR